MSPRSPRSADSLREGGSIPGLGGAPAFSLRGSAASPIPVLIAVPHAGRSYPAELASAMRDAEFAAMRLEDRYVDVLGEAVAEATGAALLIARAPRAMIDLNRAADDVDWDMIEPGGPGRPAASSGQGRRARSGLGLIPRRLPGLGEIWSRRLGRAELETRIAAVHEPYHRLIGEALAEFTARWGAALLLDLHSMPPLPSRPGGGPAAEFVIGDRFGSSCDGGVVGAAFTWLAETGRRVAHNRPYAGGYALERHAAPRQGRHAIQVEVDRRSYLDARLDRPGEGLAATAAVLAGLVTRLAEEVALLGGDPGATWPVAAE